MEELKIKKNLKKRLISELKEYWLNVIYMGLIFSAIIFYRRLVLEHYGIYLDDYFSGVIKALIIAKVVMIGAYMSISRKFENKPLIYAVLFKAVLFTVLVMLFDVAEAFLLILIHNPDLPEALGELKNHLTNVWLGGALLIFFSFIPFFAFKELVRVLGKEKVRELFLKKRTD
jgi:uncharacterized membrane protein